MARHSALRHHLAALAANIRRAARQAQSSRIGVERPINLVGVVNAGEPGAVRKASSVQHLGIPQGKEAGPPAG